MSETSENPAISPAQANPLLRPWLTPFETPPFQDIVPEHFLPAFEQAFADHAAEVAAITLDPATPDFANTITALERSGKLLSKVSNVFYDLVSAHSNPALLEIDKEVSLRMARHWNPIMMNAVLFGRVAALRDKRAPLGLTSEEERLRERTRASGTEWALGTEARCRALLSDDEVSFQESVARLARSRAVVELARSRLVYGEWLRQQNRRVDAREQLRAAHEMFSHMGASAFAERARRELSASGEVAPRRTGETLDQLTTQEAQVARLAALGHTNPEIGAQLFISARTVEYHLHKVFPKLGISSRKELRRAFPDAGDSAVLA